MDPDLARSKRAKASDHGATQPPQEPMKTHRLLAALCLASSGAALAQTTQHYTDATGEIAVGTFPHLDINAVDVTVDAAAANITFKISLQGNPSSPNWGKYMIGIRSSPGGTTTSCGWGGRPISMAGGMTHWIGCWMDGGTGTNTYVYNGSWVAGTAGALSSDATSLSVTLPVTALALSPGETFSFDVYSSGGGGGDTAVEALSAATPSATGWGAAYSTGAVGAATNPARTFTMPGSPDYATWIDSFGLFGNDALPGNDYDHDGLTNQQEFDLDIEGLSPAVDDSDGDGLKDGEETLTGIYVDATHTGSNPVDADSDDDGETDGDEVKSISAAYVRDPNHYNYAKITVPGTFNLPNAWNETGASVPSNEMTVAGTSLTGQFQYSLLQRIATPKTSITFKFTNGAWATNWGTGAAAGKAALNGGNIERVVDASGIYRISFNTATLDYSVTRATFPDATAYLAAYGLAAGADQDADGRNNEAEFTANTDPYNADSDGDGLPDNTDPEPLVVAPESREVVFQVNMSVAISQGNFNATTGVVRVVGQFEGWNTSGGVVLSDPNADGIYTGSYTAAGFAGISFGNYKFFIDGGPNGGYETSADRTFNLGPNAQQQVLPVVYYNDAAPATGFTAWIATFPGLSDTSREGDPDGDGLSNEKEFFFGSSPAVGSGSAVSASNSASGMVLRWLQRSSGVTYTLQQNASLAGEWTTSPVNPATANDQSGAPADYTRMEATIPVSGTRNFLRVNGAEN